jgi:two-component system response regulator NreC
LQKGASGYILKCASVFEMKAAMRLVIAGGVAITRTLSLRLLRGYQERTGQQALSSYDPLTPRESEILRLVYKGRTNKQIAREMYLSVRTVERHRSSIIRKAGLKNRAELVAYAVRKNIYNGGKSA